MEKGSTSFKEMTDNFQRNFGVVLDSTQIEKIRIAIEKENWGLLQQYTGLAVSMGDHECPISVEGKYGLGFEEATDLYITRVRRRVEETREKI